MEKRMLYEIETRVYFNSLDEVFNTLPFLHVCLKKETEFETRMYGIELFKSGKILRVSDVKDNETTKVYLGYKEPDIGNMYNIRNEIDEEITCEIDESYILQSIGGMKKAVNISNVNQLLESLGHHQFMTLSGINRTGSYEKCQIDMKLMQCSSLKYPILLEIEKSAETLEDAIHHELELTNFITEYKLERRIVKEEPPSLLRTDI